MPLLPLLPLLPPLLVVEEVVEEVVMENRPSGGRGVRSFAPSCEVLGSIDTRSLVRGPSARERPRLNISGGLGMQPKVSRGRNVSSTKITPPPALIGGTTVVPIIPTGTPARSDPSRTEIDKNDDY
jgi:hypothetical protein